MYNITPKTKDELFKLLTSVDFDLKQIVIADHELTDASLNLWLEDKNDFKNSLDECIELNIGIIEFADFITRHQHNCYQGNSITEKGGVYKDAILINQPIPFYTSDASSVHQQWIREEVLEEVLNLLIASVVHG